MGNNQHSIVGIYSGCRKVYPIDSLSTKRKYQTERNPVMNTNPMCRICHTPSCDWLKNLGYVWVEFTLQLIYVWCLNCLVPAPIQNAKRTSERTYTTLTKIPKKPINVWVLQCRSLVLCFVQCVQRNARNKEICCDRCLLRCCL